MEYGRGCYCQFWLRGPKEKPMIQILKIIMAKILAWIIVYWLDWSDERIKRGGGFE